MRVYIQNKHSFFDHLVSFLISSAAFSIGMKAQLLNQNLQFTPDGPQVRFSGNPHVSNLTIEINPYNLIKCIIDNKWPEKIEFHEISSEDKDKNLPPKSGVIKGINRFTSYLIMSTFIYYFESKKFLIESKFGKDTEKWPLVWNFGRVVRNAFAHGGRINFKNPNAKPVKWNSLSYAPENNDKEIIWHDISTVEMILLMEEMDSELN